MLMGGGKTTVVPPLLCLMLGDGAARAAGRAPALLEFSRGVMRSTFNSVITKPVVTPTSTATRPSTRTAEKRGAIASRGVVIDADND